MPPRGSLEDPVKGKKRLYGVGDSLSFGNGVAYIATIAGSATVHGPAGLDAGEYDDALVYVNITSVGTANLVVQWEVSPDNGTTWCLHTATGTLSANGATVLKVIRPIGLMWRVSAIYGGSGNITYIISVDLSRDGP